MRAIAEPPSDAQAVVQAIKATELELVPELKGKVTTVKVTALAECTAPKDVGLTPGLTILLAAIAEVTVLHQATTWLTRLSCTHSTVSTLFTFWPLLGL